MKKNIALVTGGYSNESVISYKTAVTIEANLDKEKFNIYVVDISPVGWTCSLPGGEKKEIDKNDFSVSFNGTHIKFDAVYIGMHGTPGEDGKLQGYFDSIKLPYTGCDAATSAITFNKRYTTAVAGMGGISVARSILVFKSNPLRTDDIAASLKFPVFVKPNNGGSSIGMSKVADPEQLDMAIKKAFNEDDQVLVEEMINGREFTIGVFRKDAEVITLPITEVKTEKDFFDYEAKYEGKSKEITPAEIEEETAYKIREAARKIYMLFNCHGVVRIDFIYNELDGNPYMLEINTIPGQSEASIIPQQVKAMGLKLKDFYASILEDAFNRK
ncbi:MAG: D-alanine--D-alanine ligase [Chitinophagaceae bacterium]|nr:D-alanine--D-alanine ligase [Chitinophagaceae bacterium]